MDCSRVQFPSSLKPRPTALLPQAAPTSNMMNKISFAPFSKGILKAMLGDTRKIYSALLPQAAPTSSMINKISFAPFSQVQRCFKAKLGDTTRKIYTALLPQAAPTSSMILELVISFAPFSQFKRYLKLGDTGRIYKDYCLRLLLAPPRCTTAAE